MLGIVHKETNGYSADLQMVYTADYGGVFEQLARYTMRYQESDLHLSLYSS